MERMSLMGTTAQVTVVGDQGLRNWAFERLDELERRWSRFVPDSEVSALNEAEGQPRIVSPDTCRLVAVAVQAWRLTDGRFDPTVHDAVVDAGYDATFRRGEQALIRREAQRAPGCSDIVVDHHLGLVWLGRGVRFDAGGIGKGLAADLVAEELIGRGAAAALVEIGGDMRAAGRPPRPWRIEIENPHATATPIGECRLDSGGVATSSRLKRTWLIDGRPRHHLIDPATGANPRAISDTVTVVAGTAWWAEALTKSLFLSPYHDWSASLAGASALGIDPDGDLTMSGDRRIIRLDPARPVLHV